MLFLLVLSLVMLSSAQGGYGPEKVKQLSGYITVPGPRNDNGTHLFYWFFESRTAPSSAPFILWLTGGPGCSSMLALFYENGPYIINKDLSLKLNPYSWNAVANVMWLDQPVGTGFSYADHFSDYVTNEKMVAEDLYEFLQGFFKQYPQYNRKVNIIGESYGGHYVPAFGARIVAGNRHLAPGDVHIDFTGMAVGNGWVDPKIQYSAYADLLYEAKLLDIVSTTTYDDIAYPTCKLLIETTPWLTAFEECSLGMEGVLLDAEIQSERSINVYDVTIPCEVEPLCYDFSLADKLFAEPSVLKALGVSPKADYTDCNMEVHTLLLGDWIGNFAVDVPTVLAQKIPVLIYEGTNDWICNWIGAQRWTDAMIWPGQNKFLKANTTDWKIANGKVAGEVKTSGGFTFLKVFDAGHMVPLNQPEAALAMVRTFIFGRPW